MPEQLSPESYLDALLTLPQLFGPQVSKDGQWVAWTWLGVGDTMDVYAAPADGSAAPVRLSHSDQNTWLTCWKPDSTAVVVGQDKNGNERVQLFQVDLAQPGTMQPLTEADPSYYLRGGMLHPGGRWLVYAANYDVESDSEIEASWIYRHDLETGERLPLAKPLKGAFIFPRLNPQGTHILYNRIDQHPAGYQLWLVDIEGANDREIVNVGDDKKVTASWLPDGQRILLLAEADTHTRLGIWELESGALRWLIDDPARNIERAYFPHNSAVAVVVEVKEACAHPSFLNVDTGEETVLGELPGNLIPIAPVGKDGEWIGSYYSAQQPTDLVRFYPTVLKPASFTSLTRIAERTILTADHLAPAEDFRWESVDGLTIQGWLYRAKDPARGTIVYVHGGPTYHLEDRIDTEIQFYVSRGFNVLAPNYRGSTGFSRAFREAIKEDGWGGREQDDIRTGVEALLRAGVAKPGKVGITGTSYGGYSSWCAITRFAPEIIAAAAPVCGMTDLVVDYETTRPDLRPYSEEMMGGSPQQVPQRYHERSPINFVSNIKGRLMIVQGLQDPNVTPENVRAVKTALDHAGVEYQLLTFDDEGHGIDRPHNQKTLFLSLAEFFSAAFETAG